MLDYQTIIEIECPLCARKLPFGYYLGEGLLLTQSGHSIIRRKVYEHFSISKQKGEMLKPTKPETDHAASTS